MWTQIRLLPQEQSDLDPNCLLKTSKHFSKQQKQTIFVCFGALSVDKCEFQFIYCRDFHDMHARLRGSNNLLTVLTLIIPDPFLRS